MASKVNPLAEFPDSALIEELARRTRKRAQEKPDDAPWCHDCTNFVFWTAKADPPSDHNPCRLGHKVKFKAPENASEAHSGECGFYRVVCEDREERTEAK